MNRSYKLFDTSWDGCSYPDNKPCIITKLSKDISGNKVCFSDILKDGSVKENDDGNTTTFLLIDYFPQYKTPCVVSYYIKRLLQIINLISGCICVCEDRKNQELLNELMDDFYNDKQEC